MVRKKINIVSISFTLLFVILMVALIWQVINIYTGRPIKEVVANEETKTDTVITEEIIEQKERVIDGVLVAVETEDYYPKAIMIENNVEARPQSGLDMANLVIEAPVEGGITRFMAIYADESEIGEIGPVRSARPYFLDWSQEYDALYGHVGGSPEALKEIKNNNSIIDLNQFYQSQYFWRSSKRAMPHNVYTSSDLLNEAVKRYSLTDAQIDKQIYKDDLALEDRPEDFINFQIDFSTYTYRVEWKYDRVNNEYIRYQAGERHLMKDGSEIRAKNIIIQKTKVTSIDSEDRKKIKTIGEGSAIIFLDGKNIEGTWKKDKAGDRTKFYDIDNNEIKFNRGKTWIEVVDKNISLTY